MRKCIRCDVEMIGGLNILSTMHQDALRVTRPQTSGMLPKNWFGNLKAAVCPKCGYVETYLDRLDKIQQYQK